MSIPIPSKLDQAQCIQGAFDEATGRLRVDALINTTLVAPPGLEVSIDDADDSIKIGNGSGLYAQITSSRALVVDGSSSIQPVSQSGVWTIGRTWSLLNTNDSVNVGNFPATQAVTQSGSWLVTANAGTNLNTSLLQLDATGSKLNLTQASTTSGQTGPLIQGAVTTNVPSYSSGQTNPLSLDTSGLLRISLKDTPTNTNKFLVTADPITFASPQHTILDSGTLTTITNPVTVSQSSAANLNATIVGTGIFATQATQSGTWNINNISGTISLPTGAATESTLSIFSNRFTSPTSTITRVAVSTSNSTLLSSNVNRKGASFYNETSQIVYLKLGVAASTTSYTIQMFPNSILILDSTPIYTGQVDAILASGSGNIQVDELI